MNGIYRNFTGGNGCVFQAEEDLNVTVCPFHEPEKQKKKIGERGLTVHEERSIEVIKKSIDNLFPLRGLPGKKKMDEFIAYATTAYVNIIKNPSAFECAENDLRSAVRKIERHARDIQGPSSERPEHERVYFTERKSDLLNDTENFKKNLDMLYNLNYDD